MGQGNQKDGSLCQDCMVSFKVLTYFHFLQKKHSDNDTQISWKRQLRQECLELKDKCHWANQILNCMKSIKPVTIPEHFQDVYLLSQFSRGISQLLQKQANPHANGGASYVNQLNLTSSYQHQTLISQNSNSSEERKYQQNQKADEQQIFQVIKHSVITDDEVIDAYKKQTNIRSNMSSFGSRLSSAPSCTYQDHLLLQKEQLEWTEALKDQVMKQIKFFSTLTKLFEKHLSSPQNQLHQITQIFITSFVGEYESIEEIQNIQELNINKCFNDLQQYSRVLWQTAVLYYDLESVRQIQIRNNTSIFMTDDNLLNFFVSYLLKNENVYRIIYEHLCVKLKDDIKNTAQNLLQLQDITTVECGISEKFRLDLSTYYYLRTKYPKAVCKEYEPIRPYKESYMQLQKLKSKKSPCSKIKVILRAQEEVIKCIRRFYKNYNCQFDGCLDADDMFPIQLYVLLKSQVYDIDVHLNMTEKLATNKILSGTSGYYIVTLRAACEHLTFLQKERSKKTNSQLSY